MSNLSLILKILGGVTAVIGIMTYISYQNDIRAIRERVMSGSQVIETKCGLIEYATIGEGPPVLVVHGAIGGYDQGILMARMMVGDGFRYIAPSRFGHLRTPLPANATPAAQADSHACLLNALNISKVSVVGVSAGAPSSMQFALTYPHRTSALILMVPAAWAPPSPQAKVKFPVPAAMYKTLLGSDFLMWLMMKIAPSSLESAFGIDQELKASLTSEEMKDISDFMHTLLPSSLRKGDLNMPPPERYPLENISVPTIVFSAADDTVSPPAWGKYTAENIPGAKFILLESGGHFLVGQHARVRKEVSENLKKHWASEAQEGK